MCAGDCDFWAARGLVWGPIRTRPLRTPLQRQDAHAPSVKSGRAVESDGRQTLLNAACAPQTAVDRGNPVPVEPVRDRL